MDLPNPPISTSPQATNYANYLEWQAQTRKRRASSQTQFNRFQAHVLQRSFCQLRYKELSDRGAEYTREIVERRLERACECETCQERPKSRSGSDSSLDERSGSESVTSKRSSMSSFEDMKNGKGGRNSLVIQPPPRSRHHRRRAESLS